MAPRLGFARFLAHSRRREVLASAATILALGLTLFVPAGRAETSEEKEREERAQAVRVQVPTAGTHPVARPVTPSASAVVNFAEVARLAAFLPVPQGPLVGVEVPEAEPPLEPEGPAGSDALRVSLVESPQVASPSPSKSFAGLDDIPKSGSGNIVIPPDTDGAIGLTRAMVGLNNNYRIFDKSTGAVVSTTSIATFWSPTGFSTTVFDPKMLYDPYNNRWILVAVANAQAPGSSVLVGISQTSDPVGSYFLFAVDASPSDTTWADFPTIGFNKNWVAINVNMFRNANNAYVQSQCLVVNYPNLRGGALSGTFFTGTGFVASPAATYSTTENTLYVPTHLSSNGGTYEVDTITGTAAAPVYTFGPMLSRGLTWTQPSGQILPQAAPLAGTSMCSPSPPCPIETQDAQIRSTPVFRNGSIYYTQTVGIPFPGPLTHTGVQWTKLNAVTGAVQDGGRIEDPTATATNGGKWYAYPHVAVNSCGDVVIGYSQFSSSQFAAAGYSFRFSADGAGTLRDPVIYKAGEDYYRKDFGGGRNRWGDYSKAQVDPTDDLSLWALNEYAKLRVGTNDGATGANSSRWGTWWAKLGPSVSLSAGPTLAEGNTGTTAFNFPVSNGLPICAPITVSYTVNPGTATLADNDYQTPGSSIVIPASGTGGTIIVNVVGDTKREGNETFGVTITSVDIGDVGAGNTSTGTINNDDPVPSISIADASNDEGNSGTTPFSLAATLSNPSDQTITVGFATQDNTATLADNDYVAASGTLTFPAGTTGPQNATFNAKGDTKTESNEIVRVNLSSPVNATVADGAADATLVNDDGPPTISIDDVAVNETNAGPTNASFTVTLSHLSDQAVSVAYQTNDGTATVADNDYAPTDGMLNIPANTLTGPITVPVNGDVRCEPNETYTVTLSSPTGATIADDTGLGTITNDDECDVPQVTVVAPNAEEWHYLGDALDLQWTATDNVAVTSVDLRLSRDGGSSYEDIALGEANDGSYSWTVTGPPTNLALLQVIAKDAAGNSGEDVSDATWHIADVVAAPIQPAITRFALGPIRPNPSRGEVTIGYDLPRLASVRIDVVDIQGRVIATLVSDEVPAGRHQVRWRPENSVGSGLFFARARLGGKVLRERFVVTR